MKFSVVFAFLAFTSAVSGQKKQLPSCHPLDEPSQPAGPQIKVDCEKCRVEAKILQALTGKAAHVPTCIAKTNTFEPKQCYNGFCWCSTPYGVEIPNTKTKKKGLVCKKKAKKGHNCLKRAATKSFKAKCIGKDYQNVQCLVNGYCWCSMKDGSLVSNTVHNSKGLNSATQKKVALRCSKHADLKFKCGKRLGNVQHPFDLTRYLKCGAGGKTYDCSCPANTIFIPKEQICQDKKILGRANLQAVGNRKSLYSRFALFKEMQQKNAAFNYHGCDCDYHPGGCTISRPAPAGFKCRCVFHGWYTCSGFPEECKKGLVCPANCYRKSCCLRDCGGY